MFVFIGFHLHIQPVIQSTFTNAPKHLRHDLAIEQLKLLTARWFS